MSGIDVANEETFRTFMASSFTETQTSKDDLVGYVVLGSFMVCSLTYAIAGIWLVNSLGLRRHMSLLGSFLTWLVFATWGVISSVILSYGTGFFVISVLISARSSDDQVSLDADVADGVDEVQKADLYASVGQLSPQYVGSIGIAIGTLIMYKNCGRGWHGNLA